MTNAAAGWGQAGGFWGSDSTSVSHLGGDFGFAGATGEADGFDEFCADLVDAGAHVAAVAGAAEDEFSGAVEEAEPYGEEFILGEGAGGLERHAVAAGIGALDADGGVVFDGEQDGVEGGVGVGADIFAGTTILGGDYIGREASVFHYRTALFRWHSGLLRTTD